MTTREWTVRPLVSDDLEGSLELFRHVFGDEHVSREWWIWKYLENPAGPALGFVAEVGARMVGQFAVHPRKFQVRGRMLWVAKSADTMVHPEFRRQGMFRTLACATYQAADAAGMEFVYSTPNANSQLGWATIPGYRDILHCAPVWFKPVSFARLLERIPVLGQAVKWAQSAAQPVLADGRVLPSQPGGGLQFSEVTMGDQALETVSNQVSSRRTIACVRDREYLLWRYSARPDQRYRAIAAFVYGEPVAYAIYCIRLQSGLSSGFIAELEIPRYLITTVGRPLVSKLVESLRHEGVAVVSSLTMPSADESSLLSSCGFVRCPRHLMPRELYLGYRAGTKDSGLIETAVEASYWYFSWGDHDVV